MAENCLKVRTKLHRGTRRQRARSMTANHTFFKALSWLVQVVFERTLWFILKKMRDFSLGLRSPCPFTGLFSLTRASASFYIWNYVCHGNESCSTVVTSAWVRRGLCADKNSHIRANDLFNQRIQCDIGPCKVFRCREGLRQQRAS